MQCPPRMGRKQGSHLGARKPETAESIAGNAEISGTDFGSFKVDENMVVVMDGVRIRV